MAAVFDSTLLLFALLNPFLMSAYLIELIRGCSKAEFASIVLRASTIAAVVFAVFAIGGDAVFSDVLQVRFESFVIFGGIVFLVTGLRMTLSGRVALVRLRGSPGQIAGSIAMPFMTGPGTVSAAVMIGNTLQPGAALTAIAAALVTSVGSILGFKFLHDFVHHRNEALVQRYVEIVGRVTALFVGTYAVEMLLDGFEGIAGSS